MNFSGDDRPSVSSMMKNNEKIMNFDRFMYTQSKSGPRRSSIRKVSDFDRNLVDDLVQLPVARSYRGWGNDRGIRLTFEIDCSIHNDDMDQPSWSPSDREVFQGFRPLI